MFGENSSVVDWTAGIYYDGSGVPLNTSWVLARKKVEIHLAVIHL